MVTFAAVSFTFISGLAALLTLPVAAVFFTEGLALLSAGAVLPFFRAEVAGAVVFEEDFAVIFLTAVLGEVGLLLDLVIVSSGNLRSTQTKTTKPRTALPLVIFYLSSIRRRILRDEQTLHYTRVFLQPLF
ncbi:MAG: hypothetical protein ACTH1W_05865 [Advenella sp.]|uniref:hypothetical protein n=1 Tax=Advenella sp. S44 TaxID=1982755 RepID=UPI001863C232|nr:hypothetical protein [Advenella sp. S44]